MIKRLGIIFITSTLLWTLSSCHQQCKTSHSAHPQPYHTDHIFVIIPETSHTQQNLSLAGTDSDQDGLRDDVEQLIWQRYAQYKTINSREVKAIIQAARAIELSIIAGDSLNQQVTLQAYHATIRALDCLYKTKPDPSEEIHFLEYHIVNTPKRLQAYGKFNQAIDNYYLVDDSIFYQSCES